jgi:hypothetical protein
MQTKKPAGEVELHRRALWKPGSQTGLLMKPKRTLDSNVRHLSNREMNCHAQKVATLANG